MSYSHTVAVLGDLKDQRVQKNWDLKDLTVHKVMDVQDRKKYKTLKAYNQLKEPLQNVIGSLSKTQRDPNSHPIIP